MKPLFKQRRSSEWFCFCFFVTVRNRWKVIRNPYNLMVFYYSWLCLLLSSKFTGATNFISFIIFSHNKLYLVDAFEQGIYTICDSRFISYNVLCEDILKNIYVNIWLWVSFFKKNEYNRQIAISSQELYNVLNVLSIKIVFAIIHQHDRI